MNVREGIEALKALGLTEIEAAVYAFLLKKSPQTGYGIAQAVGKPVANTYKAIRSLEDKGAVLVEVDVKRLCRPTPLAVYLKLVERRFKRNREHALHALTAGESIAEDERVYQMRSIGQVFEQSRAMLKRAERIVLIDGFPKILDVLVSDIRAAARKKIELIVKAYEAVSIPRAEVVMDARGSKVIDDYPGHWLRLVVDAREHLLAFLSADMDHVHQAVWSGSRFLSFHHHCAVWDELLMDRIGQSLHESPDARRIGRALKGYLQMNKRELPGYRELLARFSRPKPRRKAGP